MLSIVWCEDGRRLFLKSSKIVADLAAIVPEDIALMQVGDYPGIEALTCAVCELRDDSRWRPPKQQYPQRLPVLNRMGF